MTRSELKARIAARFGLLTPEDVEDSVALILSALAAGMARGRRVEMRGFGTFWASYRPPRAGRNPKTGAHVSIPAKHAPRFKPTGQLRQRVSHSEKLAPEGQSASAP